jgi:biotin transporter BioY
MRDIRPAMIKTAGYLVSSVSVILLGAVAWKSASEKPLLLACLIGGMILSVLGMICRWISYQMEE